MYCYYFIMYYKRYVKSYVVVINEIYYCYRLFISSLSSTIILKSDFLI